MLRIIRFFLGYITFSVSGSFLERFINLSASRGICLFNVKRKENIFYCSSLATELNSLLKIAKITRSELKLESENGLPYILRKYKKRTGAIFGFVVFLCVHFFLSLFIWDVSIYGNKNIYEEEILNSVENLRVKNGTLKKYISPNFVENHILNEFPDVAWASVNLMGSKVKIEIKEKDVAPNINKEEKPCNIKSSNDAQIVRMEVYKGTPEVKVGDAVTEGQILVNGVVEDAFGESKLLKSSAKIFAKVKKEIKEEIDLENIKETKTNKKIKRKRLIFLGKSIPLTLAPIPKGNYKAEFKLKELKLFGSRLPIKLETEEWYKYKKEKVFLKKEEAKNVVLENIKRRENLELKDAKILDFRDDEKISNKKFILTRTYNLVKDIAKEEPIVIK